MPLMPTLPLVFDHNVMSDGAPLSNEDRQKIVRTNAQELFRLKK